MRMSTKDLCDKYGGSSKQALNRAIRAELPGGNEALDAMEDLHRIAIAGDGRGLDAMRRVVDAMEAEIRRRYGMPEKP